MTIAIAFRRTMGRWLAVVKFLNNLGSRGSYEDTLRHDAELRSEYKDLYAGPKDARRGDGGNPYALGVLEFLMNRYLSSLHVPYFGASLQETPMACAFSQKIVLEMAIKMWSAAYPFFYVMKSASMQPGRPAEAAASAFARLVACGSGMFRTGSMQAVVLVAAELRAQLQEEASLGAPLVRADYLSVVEEAKRWCLRCIEAGEINMKGYLLLWAIDAQIRCGLEQAGGNEAMDRMVRAAEDALGRCLPLLEAMNGQLQTDCLMAGSGVSSDTGTTTPSVENLDVLVRVTILLFSAAVC